jgi:hypothetical protein
MSTNQRPTPRLLSIRTTHVIAHVRFGSEAANRREVPLHTPLTLRYARSDTYG